MKVAVLAFIFGLSLAVASANIDSAFDSEELQEFTPLDYADALAEEEAFSIFGFFYFTLKACLRTLKGVNCTIKEVLSIQAAAVDFLSDINNCNVGAVKSVTALIKQVQAVVTTCDEIINLNSKVCNNEAVDDEAVGNKKTPSKCFSKLLNKLITLKKQVAKTVSLAKKVPSTPGVYADCTKTAVDVLVSVFKAFPSDIKICSKLKK
ncbi:PREDICTED: uncharacterized protein LOC108369369 [Rhagoletis zephyria]|uniref:uncharacterized protein LOC108369369 n=1 Tax=Rhagoletis zephyria TaxID=28612 RepID=UPI0008114590|nr:PREDICTED: uncharacterized protein LOC108369369 [Rhagoletis zephyria]